MTTNITVKPVSQHFYTKQITAVLWSFTCAAVKLQFQDSDLSYSKPHWVNVGQRQLTIFCGV